MLITLDDVKKYLSITNNDKDDILTFLINAKEAEFDFLIYKENQIINIPFFYYDPEKGVRVRQFKNIPTIIKNVFRVYGSNETPIRWDFIDNTLIVYENVDFAKVVLNRGFLQLPNDLKLLLIELISIEFKRSFQGEGELVYSGRTVGDVSFNYYQDLDNRMIEIKAQIMLKWGTGV